MIANRRLRRTLAGTALLVALAVSGRAEAGEYRTAEFDSLRIVVDSEWVQAAGAGYLPVRWDITNRGKDRTIEIVGYGSRSLRLSYRFRRSAPTIRQRLRLAAGDQVRFTMNVPVSGDMDNVGFDIREDGRTLQTLGYTNTSRLAGTSALIVVATNGSYAALAPGWIRPMTPATFGIHVAPAPAAAPAPPPASAAPSPSPAPIVSAPTPAPPAAPTGPPLDFTLDPTRLPGSWLGYTSVQTVVIGPREWERMDAAQRRALLTWVACGGSLLLADAGLDLLFPDAQQRPPLAGTVAEHFFGRIHVRSSAGIDQAGFANTVSAVEKTVRDPSWALPVQKASFPGGFRVPIPGVSGVPATAYLTLLVLFAILIGPVNQIVLRRRGQQALIVLTAPLIAVTFIALIVGYVALVEGFSVRGRAVSLTLLDQPGSQAVTRASASMYAGGRTPSEGLRFGRDVAVVPALPADASPFSEVLDLSETQQYTSGFLRARTPTSFETIEHRAARERLTFSRDGARLRVSNGLGATVTRLHLRHGARAYQLASPLAPGASGLLDPSTASPRSLLGSDAALAALDPLVAGLPDGAYLAVMDRSPFWSGGTPGLEERASFHLVLGRPGPLP